MLPKYLKRVIFLILLGLIISLPSLTFAQTPPDPGAWINDPNNFSKAYDEGLKGNLNVESYNAAVVNNGVLSLTKALGNFPASEDDELNKLLEKQSLLYKTGDLMASLYENPPAGTGIWLADVTSRLGLVPKAYAQGIGFSALSPILPIWKVFRNIAYAVLIIILLVIGLMIMFRTKIDPRTVISVQSALPRIVITIILITFSYPIAGFMIDLMYISMFLGINALASSITFHDWLGQPLEAVTIQGQFLNGGLISWIFGPIPTSFWISEVIGIISIFFVPFRAGKLLGTVVGRASKALPGILGTAARGGSLLGAGSGLLALLVIIVFLFAIIRLIFILLNAYIQILINIIFAPIFLLGQAIPGQSSFSSWIKNLLSNIIVFPATAILLMVANAVSDAFINPLGTVATMTQGGSFWVPPILPGVEYWAQILIGMGFALVIPQIVVSIKNLFKAKAAIPMGLSTVTGPILGGAQQALQYVYYGKTLFTSNKAPVTPTAPAKPKTGSPPSNA